MTATAQDLLSALATVPADTPVVFNVGEKEYTVIGGFWTDREPGKLKPVAFHIALEE